MASPSNVAPGVVAPLGRECDPQPAAGTPEEQEYDEREPPAQALHQNPESTAGALREGSDRLQGASGSNVR
jgi:hypothetical protein